MYVILEAENARKRIKELEEMHDIEGLMKNWYQITNLKMMIVLGIALLWIVAGWVLYAFVGAKHGPEGGLDSIANAIVYVFVWKLFIYVPAIILSAVSFSLWLYQNHRKAIIWVVAAIIACIVFTAIYNRYLRKMVDTPERVAGRINSFEEWNQHRLSSGVDEKWTESDYVCEYVEDIISEAVTECRSMYPEDDIAAGTSYINAAMNAHYRELPHVEGWEYIPDVRDISPARGDGDNEFLLNHSELCYVSEHYNRSLRRDHWYDRYQFERFVIAEWYSWLPMCAIFYDDGTMDIIIAT